jgi:hypothetical protein
VEAQAAPVVVAVEGGWREAAREEEECGGVRGLDLEAEGRFWDVEEANVGV